MELIRFTSLVAAVVSLAWASNAIAIPRPKVVRAEVIETAQVKLKLDLGQTNRQSRIIEIHRESASGVRRLRFTASRRQKAQVLDSIIGESSRQIIYKARIQLRKIKSRWSKPVSVEVEDLGGGSNEPPDTGGGGSGSPPIEQPKPFELPAGQSLCDAAEFQAVLDLVNIYRQSYSVPILSAQEQLKQSAIMHSSAMATVRIMSHDNWFNEIMAYQYSGTHFGQNVAYVFSSAQSVVNAWMNSSGHRANILKYDYRHLGVGCVIDSRGVKWWTQNFGG